MIFFTLCLLYLMSVSFHHLSIHVEIALIRMIIVILLGFVDQGHERETDEAIVPLVSRKSC